MKVVIAGGGAVGSFIADELYRVGHEVHIIEQDGDHAAVRAVLPSRCRRSTASRSRATTRTCPA